MPNESSETSILPPSRLNPKLTRRAPPPTIEVESSFSNLEVTNPRIALLHSGTWIPKQYENGMHVTGTGLWTCCNDIDHFSMYCESEALRKQIVDKKIQKENEVILQIFYYESRLIFFYLHCYFQGKSPSIIQRPYNRNLEETLGTKRAGCWGGIGQIRDTRGKSYS